jgi:hypothetical protein
MMNRGPDRPAPDGDARAPIGSGFAPREETKALLDSVLYGEATPERSEDARLLIAELYAVIEKGEEPPEAFDLLRHAFPLILASKSADEAFGLKADRRKMTTENQERDMLIAAFVVLRVRQIGAARKAEGRLEGQESLLLTAKGEAASRFFTDNTGDRAVDRAYLAHGHLFSSWFDDDLSELIGLWGSHPR